MDLFTIARIIDEKGNVEYQIGGNTPPALAIQMIFEAGMAIAKSEGEEQARASDATKARKDALAAKKEEGAKKAAEAAERKREAAKRKKESRGDRR